MPDAYFGSSPAIATEKILISHIFVALGFMDKTCNKKGGQKWFQN